MDKHFIVLPDGREVRRGPWIERCFEPGKFRIGIYVVKPGENERFNQENVAILEGQVPRHHFGIQVPSLEILNEGLWCDDLRQAVIDVLRRSDFYKPAVGFIIAKLISDGNQSRLILDNGLVLVGNLYFRTAFSDLCILGDILDAAGQCKKTALFRILNLRQDFWPSLLPVNPGYDRNKKLWCKKLEGVVVSYVNSLLPFTKPPMDKQIQTVLGNLGSRSEWSKKCRLVYSSLVGIDFDHRNDPRLVEAFRLIDEVARS